MELYCIAMKQSKKVENSLYTAPFPTHSLTPSLSLAVSNFKKNEELLARYQSGHKQCQQKKKRKFRSDRGGRRRKK